MHALLVDHYLHGAFYPRGGSSEIAFHTIPVIQRAGGAVLTRATVEKVLLDSAGRACGEVELGAMLCTCQAACSRGAGVETWGGRKGSNENRARGQQPPLGVLEAGPSPGRVTKSTEKRE